MSDPIMILLDRWHVHSHAPQMVSAYRGERSNMRAMDRGRGNTPISVRCCDVGGRFC